MGAQRAASTDAMIGVGVTILVITALHFAHPVFAPLAFALFIIALVWPVQKRLQQHMPKLAAMALTILATVIVFFAFGWIIAWGVTRVGRSIVSDAARFQAVYSQAATWLEGHGIEVAGLWTEYFNIGTLVPLIREATTRLGSTFSFSLVVLVYVVLGLLEVDDSAHRLRAMKNGAVGAALLNGGARTGEKFRSYMLVRTLMSAMTGVLVWGFVSLAGLPLAAEWGVIAFALNYIPFIGPFFATVLPTLFAIAHLESWQMVVVIFGGLNLIQFLVGSYLEPRLAGSALSVSPFIVLFAVFFWTFVWGLSGAFIGVPILVAIVTLCDQHPSSRWFADILGNQQPTQEAAT